MYKNETMKLRKMMEWACERTDGIGYVCVLHRCGFSLDEIAEHLACDMVWTSEEEEEVTEFLNDIRTNLGKRI